MRFIETALPEVLVIEPDVFRDARGFFLETYSEAKYAEGGIRLRFVQDNQSRSMRGTLRGLHAQRGRPQAKLVRAVRGEIFDVALDIRRASPTFGKWAGERLSENDFRQMFIPPGFAHGFCVLSESADVEYKCSELYDRADEIGIRWNDPRLGISWPIRDPVLSPKDASLPTLAELAPQLA